MKIKRDRINELNKYGFAKSEYCIWRKPIYSGSEGEMELVVYDYDCKLTDPEIVFGKIYLIAEAVYKEDNEYLWKAIELDFIYKLFVEGMVEN